jgi:hypothetical protein
MRQDDVEVGFFPIEAEAEKLVRFGDAAGDTA